MSNDRGTHVGYSFRPITVHSLATLLSTTQNDPSPYKIERKSSLTEINLGPPVVLSGNQLVCS